MDKSSVSLVNLIVQADIIVQFVILLMISASMISWAIIFDKFIKFKILKHRSDRFEDAFENNVPLEEIFNQAKSNDNHPLARIFLSCLREWKSNNIKQIASAGNDAKNSLKERLVNNMQIVSNRAMIKLESGLNLLAIIGSSAPFVGLFGTVWGIMNSFQSIAISRNTSLAIVAPGIAEALFATALGLLAAIPAVVAYNKFTSNSRKYTQKLENFTQTFISII